MNPVDRAGTWPTVRRVLAIRLDNLGDVLMTTPALAAVRESVPDASITLLASPAGAALAPHLDDIDDCIAYAAPWVKNAAGAGAGAERRLADDLAERRFDAAIVFTTCTQSALPAALMCRLAGIPLVLAHCRENPYRLLSDWRPETDRVAAGMRHEVQRQLDLVAGVGYSTADTRLRFTVRPADRQSLREALARAGIGAAPRYFVVHPGASAPSRRYPADRFGAAAASIARMTGLEAVYTGDAGERATVDAARRAMAARSTALTGELALGELAALIEGAELLVTNNTGPAHVAAAVGTPVVDLYALTNPQHTPWHVPATVLSHDVPCRNCLKSECPAGHHACLLGVETSRVVTAALELLAAGRSIPTAAAA